MVGSESFSVPQKAIDRARRAIAQVDEACIRLFNRRNFKSFVDRDPVTGDNVLKIQLDKDVPDLLEERLTDALNNTRNAFDQSVYAACIAMDHPLKDAHYPWATNAKDLLIKLEKGKVGRNAIPRELWPTIIQQEPYYRSDEDGTGDTLIRTMAAFANRKHTVGVEIQCAIAEVDYGQIYVENSPELVIPMPKWDAETNTVWLARWRGGVYFNKEQRLRFNLAFSADAPEHIRNVTAYAAVLKFIQKSQLVLDQLKSAVEAVKAS